MARRLPRAHPDDDDAVRKLRLRVFKAFYQAYYEWDALRRTGLTITDTIISPMGEEIYMPDLLTGYDYLPRRQQQSFELICLRSFSEAAATKEIYGTEAESGGRKRSSTVVQQYAQQALERMVSAYDEMQAGTWDPVTVMASRKLNGRLVRHDSAAARRNRLGEREGSRRPAVGAPRDVHNDRREDRDPDRSPDEAALGSRGLQRVRAR